MNLHRRRSDMGRSCSPCEVYTGPPRAHPSRPDTEGLAVERDWTAWLRWHPSKSHVRPDPRDGALFGNEAFADVIS